MQLKAGEVNFIWSEEEFDWVLSEHAQQLVVLEASLTWCRPCKGFERAFQVSHLHHHPADCINSILDHAFAVSLIPASPRASHAPQSCRPILRSYLESMIRSSSHGSRIVVDGLLNKAHPWRVAGCHTGLQGLSA